MRNTTRKDTMGFDQYHEPPDELPEETRTFARMIAALGEEAEAINWYEQRMAVERDQVARSIMEDAQKEEFKHFGMDLEFLLRQAQMAGGPAGDPLHEGRHRRTRREGREEGRLASGPSLLVARGRSKRRDADGFPCLRLDNGYEIL